MNKGVKMNISRRGFLSCGGKLSLLMLVAYYGGLSLKKSGKQEEELVIVNGWVLKKGDLI